MKTSVDPALRLLGRTHPEILALYFFGSQTRDQAGPLSDLDVAVLLREDAVRRLKDPDRTLHLIAGIAHACRRSDVDVTVLNHSTPLLAYEVVRHGKLVYEREKASRVVFEARALQRYLDIAPFLAVSRRYLKRQLLDGTYGG